MSRFRPRSSRKEEADGYGNTKSWPYRDDGSSVVRGIPGGFPGDDGMGSR